MPNVHCDSFDHCNHCADFLCEFNPSDKKDYTMSNVPFMAVRCISIRENHPDQIQIGHAYLIDKTSIWLDADGDAYGVVYDAKRNRVGQMLLSHFTSV